MINCILCDLVMPCRADVEIAVCVSCCETHGGDVTKIMAKILYKERDDVFAESAHALPVDLSSRFITEQLDESYTIPMARFRFAFADLEKKIILRLDEDHEREMALTRLEEAFMWIGKAVQNKNRAKTWTTEK